jgi:hypothetical protein
MSRWPKRTRTRNIRPSRSPSPCAPTGDHDRDKRRIKTLYGTLISYHGRDKFSFQIFENGKGHLIDFPNDTTRICPELLERLKKLMGEERLARGRDYVSVGFLKNILSCFMSNDSRFYFDVLYPLQDRVIKVINLADTGFYLTGGTAASRGYLQHRFSDDLDYFVNDDASFGLWVERIIQALNKEWMCEVLMKEERFARLNLTDGDAMLKIEMINDVPARVGSIENHPILGRLDSAENILANKVTALLGREEPKDLADVWGFCFQKNLSLRNAITGAQGKAAGIFPADLARVLCSVQEGDWESIRWITTPPLKTFISQLTQLGDDLLLSK